MGSLTLPTAGSVYIDSQIAIYTVERFPVYVAVLEALWLGAQSGVFNVVSSDLTLMETLVVPLRNGDARLAGDFERLWRQVNTALLPITQDVLREAARLRASIPGLRTPDAVHAATALLHGCAMFLTNDLGFRRIPGLSFAFVDEVIAAP